MVSVDPWGRNASYVQKVQFWEATRKWFEEQGYFLYENIDVGEKKYAYAKPTKNYPDTPKMSYRGIIDDPFPYAFMGPSSVPKDRPPYSTMERLDGQVMYAQDVDGRHLAIKMVRTAEEYKVLSLLKDQPRLRDPNSFVFVMPILDILPYDDHWFCVMPRWGLNLNRYTFFPTFQIAMKYLISLLEGLAFLHELRIFHRDIAVKNTLVNHISSVWSSNIAKTEYHEYLKLKGALRYCIMDFDLAMVLDEETYGSNPRLPIELVECVGFGARPYETMHAYVDFDPFKYDVACLGIHFSDYFTQIIGDVPLLAPLIDRMITSDIDKRFTASEALAFVRNRILPTVSSLDRIKLEKPDIAPVFHRFDRWEGLPESFIAEWASYREDYASWTMRLQDWLYTGRFSALGWYIMHYYRYIMRAFGRARRLLLRQVVWFFESLGLNATIGSHRSEEMFRPGDEVMVKQVLSRKVGVDLDPVDADYALYIVVRNINLHCQYADVEFHVKASQIKDKVDSDKPVERNLSAGDLCYTLADMEIKLERNQPSITVKKNTPLIIGEANNLTSPRLWSKWDYLVRIAIKGPLDVPHIVDRKLTHQIFNV